MAEALDRRALLREIYGESWSRHVDLYELSNRHREEHGPSCSVYPSEPESGTLWPFLTAMVGARRFLEIGCGLGYTAALMAEAGGAGCRVDTIEAVAEHADLAEAEMRRRGLSGIVHVLRGEGRDILPTLEGPYDIVFVDAGWWDYPAFLPHLIRVVRPGGVLVTSNLFPLFEEWAREMQHKDALRDYLTRLARDPRFRTFILPGWRALSYRMAG